MVISINFDSYLNSTELDNIKLLVQQIFDASHVIIAVNEKNLWVSHKIDLGPLISVFDATLSSSEPLIYEDIELDLKQPLLLDGKNIKFYAGFPFSSSISGVLCLLDASSKSFNESQNQALSVISGFIDNLIELKKFRQECDKTVDNGLPFDKDSFLANFQGIESVAKKSIDSFVNFIPGLMADLKQSIESHNKEDVERNAHTLKGVLSNFYAEASVSLAFKLEKDCDDMEKNLLIYEKLDGELQRLSTALQQFSREYFNEV